jgi:6-phosphogluconolactonase (cycloisomerase 2 family)
MIKKMLFLLLLLPLVASCGENQTTEATVPVRLKLILPAGGSTPSQGLSKATLADITRIVLEVRGQGMSPMFRSLDVPSNRIVIISINIPTGPLRLFIIRAFDINGNLVFRGREVTRDIHRGDAPEIPIILDSVDIPVSLSVGSATLNEANGTTSTSVTATLSATSTEVVVVTLAKSGNATDGVDYTLPNTIIIPAGALEASVQLTTLSDTVNDPSETVVISIASITPNIPFNNVPITVTILDDKPKPRFAYVANQGSNTISIYTVNLPNGQLRANGYVTAGTGTSTNILSATLDPLGRFVYVVNAGVSTTTAGTITTYTINPSTGALTNTSATSTDGVVHNPATIDPSGRFLYVSNEGTSTSTAGTITTYTINPSTGALTNIGMVVVNGSNGGGIGPVFVDPLGKFAYAGGETSTSTPFTVSTYTIETTGALTNTGEVANVGISPSAGTLHPSGRFFYVANESNTTSTTGTISSYTIDQTTGKLAKFGPTLPTDVGRPSSAAIDPSGRFFYVANESNTTPTTGTISTYTINPSTGELTNSNTAVVPAGVGELSVTVDPSGSFLYGTNAGSNDISTYTIDNITGTLTPTGDIRTQSVPRSIAISGGLSPVTYTPKFAYAANQFSDTVSAYTIDPSSGTLASTSTPISAGTTPVSIAADPTGRFAYTANSGSQDIFVYAISPASGGLTQMDGSVPAPSVRSIIIDPSGRFAYAVENTTDFGFIATYSIDPLTGALTQVEQPLQAGGQISALTLDATGRFGYVASSNQITLFQISPTTGSPTISTPPFQAGQNLISALIDPTGKFAYFIDRNISVGPSFILAFGIDPINGTLATGTPIQVGSQPVAMAVTPTGRSLYLIDQTGNISAFQIDPQSGALVPFGQPVPTGVNPKSITIDVSGRFLYVGNDDTTNGNISSYTIDPATGGLTPNPLTVPAGTGPNSITSTGVIQ